MLLIKPKVLTVFVMTLMIVTALAGIFGKISTTEAGPVEIIGDVVDSFDSPGNFPTGLAWEGGSHAYLWNADYDTHKIYKIVPCDGNYVKSFDSPGNFPTGLAWDGQYLWNADDNNDTIYKLDSADGSVVKSFDSPGTSPTGLAWDGQYLWNADDNNDTIYKLDSADGSVVKSFDSPGTSPTGLAWDGQYLWNAEHIDKKIYMLNPDDGSIIYSINSSGYGPWGLTWHDQYIWNADNHNDSIYKINADYGENQPPVADFTWSPEIPEPGEYAIFDHSNSYDPDGYITYYKWYFEEDRIFEIVDNINPSLIHHKWDLPGEYKVSLTVIDNDTLGFMNTKTKIVMVREENPPTVDILFPEEGNVVNGTVSVEGTANDTDDSIKKVEVRIDDGGWNTATGTSSWNYPWHTVLLEMDEGLHRIQARSYNGVSYAYDEVNVTLDNLRPHLIVDLSGGIGSVSAKIKNNGDEAAEDVVWFINVSGGFLGLIKADSEGSAAMIAPGQEKEVSLDEPLVGFGPINVEVVVEAGNTEHVSKSMDGFVLGLLVIV